jgi:5,5'-dehydrodivanillate O-demethylase oxygenase subunit
MNAVQAQDHMAWETQGPIANRMHERLTSSDRGVVLLREVMLREMRRVLEGHDSLGVVRDPNQNATMIDTHLNQTIQQFGLVGADQAVNG